jgi:hypothetical protein
MYVVFYVSFESIASPKLPESLGIGSKLFCVSNKIQVR